MVVGIGTIFVVVLTASRLQMVTNAAVHQITAMPLWYRVALVTRAAFVGETLFRGYGIERITELTGSSTLAPEATWLAFTIAHVSYWSLGGLFIAGFGGLVLMLLYVWGCDLSSNMVAHWVADAAGFLLPY